MFELFLIALQRRWWERIAEIRAPATVPVFQPEKVTNERAPLPLDLRSTSARPPPQSP